MNKEKLRNVWCEIVARNAIARLLCPHCVIVGRTLLDTHGAKIGPISFFFPALLEQLGRLLLLLARAGYYPKRKSTLYSPQ